MFRSCALVAVFVAASTTAGLAQSSYSDREEQRLFKAYTKEYQACMRGALSGGSRVNSSAISQCTKMESDYLTGRSRRIAKAAAHSGGNISAEGEKVVQEAFFDAKLKCESRGRSWSVGKSMRCDDVGRQAALKQAAIVRSGEAKGVRDGGDPHMKLCSNSLAKAPSSGRARNPADAPAFYQGRFHYRHLCVLSQPVVTSKHAPGSAADVITFDSQTDNRQINVLARNLKPLSVKELCGDPINSLNTACEPYGYRFTSSWRRCAEKVKSSHAFMKRNEDSIVGGLAAAATLNQFKCILVHVSGASTMVVEGQFQRPPR